MMHGKTLYYNGAFDNEERAAMSVNLLCDKYGKDRKNPNVTMEPDAIQKVIHLLYMFHRKGEIWRISD